MERRELNYDQKTFESLRKKEEDFFLYLDEKVDYAPGYFVTISEFNAEEEKETGYFFCCIVVSIEQGVHTEKGEKRIKFRRVSETFLITNQENNDEITSIQDVVDSRTNKLDNDF